MSINEFDRIEDGEFRHIFYLDPVGGGLVHVFETDEEGEDNIISAFLNREVNDGYTHYFIQLNARKTVQIGMTESQIEVLGVEKFSPLINRCDWITKIRLGETLRSRVEGLEYPDSVKEVVLELATVKNQDYLLSLMRQAEEMIVG